MVKKTIQRLQFGATAVMVPTWVNTTYVSMAEAKRFEPNEVFRVKWGAVTNG